MELKGKILVKSFAIGFIIALIITFVVPFLIVVGCPVWSPIIVNAYWSSGKDLGDRLYEGCAKEYNISSCDTTTFNEFVDSFEKKMCEQQKYEPFKTYYGWWEIPYTILDLLVLTLIPCLIALLIYRHKYKEQLKGV